MSASTSPIIVVAPDSFKGSLSAVEVAAALAHGLRRVWGDADVRNRPMADGGEGTLDAVLSCGGVRRNMSVAGASGDPVDAAYGVLGDNTTAVIEIAQVVGLTDAVGSGVEVELRTTRGVGELIRHLLDTGITHFMIGLGGSSTNDAGAGLLSALGLSLSDAAGAPMHPSPASLCNVAFVDAARLHPRLHGARITIMSDVDNPLLGATGATSVFGPQKGVRRDRIADIDSTLGRFAALCERAMGRSARDLAGAGAAGGLGFALQLLGGEMRSGAEVVADLIGLDAAITDASWVITGEGRSDAQTLHGKAPFIVARRAAARDVPVTLISGGIDRSALDRLSLHFAGCFSLPFGPATLEQCIADAPGLLADSAEQVARLFAGAMAARRP